MGNSQCARQRGSREDLLVPTCATYLLGGQTLGPGIGSLGPKDERGPISRLFNMASLTRIFVSLWRVTACSEKAK